MATGRWLRRLPYTAHVADGDSLPSWIDRTAERMNVQRRDLWLHMGLMDGSQTRAPAYGLVIAPERLEDLSFTTGLELDVINGMLLSRFDPKILPWYTVGLTKPASIQTWSRGAWHSCARRTHARSAWQAQTAYGA